MKKIAIASEGQKVSQHFGYCEGFKISEIEDDKVVNEDFLKNPGHQPGLLPKLLSEKGVDLVISGGMGGNAIALFNESNIDVITGASGELSKIVDDYISGDLTSGSSPCREHVHQGNGMTKH